MTIMSIAKKLVTPITTIVSMVVVPSSENWDTIAEALEKKDWKNAGACFVAGMTGIELGRAANVEFFRILNPVDLGRAPYTKIALISSLTVDALGKITGFIREVFSELT